MAKRHYPPAYIKYNLKNPAITLRLKKELHDRIELSAKANGITRGEVIRRLFDHIPEPAPAEEISRLQETLEELQQEVDYAQDETETVKKIADKTIQILTEQLQRNNIIPLAQCLKDLPLS